jgi:polysaccharide biosynthesis/export protein
MKVINVIDSSHLSAIYFLIPLVLITLKNMLLLRNKSIAYFLLSITLLTSCYSNKKIVYLQDKNLSHVEETIIKNNKSAYYIQPNDVLSIKVQSLESEISNIFNINLALNSFGTDPGNLFLGGYSVNDQGYITIPIIGKIKVNGLTLDEVQTLAQSEVNKYLNNATVILKLISFKITVLGEVNNPGYHYVYNDQLTVFEALGMAGDITRFGNRKEVKLIRQTAKTTEIIMLDLTDPKIIESIHYFLKPNDVLYVEPFKAQARRVNLDLLSLLFSAITTTVLVLNFIDSN